jgi:hypothetical protein
MDSKVFVQRRSGNAMRKRFVAQTKVMKKDSDLKNIFIISKVFSFPEKKFLRNAVAQKRCGGDALRSYKKNLFRNLELYFFVNTHTFYFWIFGFFYFLIIFDVSCLSF